MLINFRQLLLDEMTKEDLDYLANVVRLDPEMDPQFVYNKLANGEMLPWRLETTRGNSIILLEVKQKSKERVLYIWYLSGKGLVGNGKYVLDTLEYFARLHNCTAIEALTNDRLARWISRPEGGFEIKHHFVRKELN